MASLYELTAEYADMMARLDAAETDEEVAAIWEELSGMEGEITDKADMYARIMRNKRAEAEMFKAEAKRLTAKAKAAEGVADRLKGMVQDTMIHLGLKDIRTSIGKWRIQRNPASCEVIDPAKVPTEYHIPQPDTIDRAAILKAFRETGEIPDGCDITQSEGIRFS